MNPKATITITLVDDQGREYHGSVVLTPAGSSRKPSRHRRMAQSAGGISFGSNLRAFVKRYAKNRSGARQFTLILAFIAKGDPSVEVTTASIATAWKKAAGLLGGPYQTMYGTLARENDWAESPKRGVCKLSNNWRECLAAEDNDD